MTRSGKRFFLSVLVLALSISCFACSRGQNGTDEPAKDPETQEAGDLSAYTALLGADDDDLTAAKGEGEPNTFEVDGVDALISRTYSEESVLGFSASATFSFGDGKHVSDVVFTFPSATFAELQTQLTTLLGAPGDVVAESETANEEAIWSQDGFHYSLLDAGEQVTLTLSEETEG